MEQHKVMIFQKVCCEDIFWNICRKLREYLGKHLGEYLEEYLGEYLGEYF